MLTHIKSIIKASFLKRDEALDDVQLEAEAYRAIVAGFINRAIDDSTRTTMGYEH